MAKDSIEPTRIAKALLWRSLYLKYANNFFYYIKYD